MSRTATVIGPSDHGRRMNLEEFEQAEGQAGYVYELSRGVVIVVDVPSPQHLAQVNAARRQFSAYDLEHPGHIHAIAGGGECKILLAGLHSERHPDLAIYKTPPPEQGSVWGLWIPAIVVEVVSPGSAHRDYVEKRDEYLRFDVSEYWIIDAQRQQMTVLRQSNGDWAEEVFGLDDTFASEQLPGFVFACEPVFQAANIGGE